MGLMSIAPEVIELEQLAQRVAVPMEDALIKAGVDRTTYWRWHHHGKEPLNRTLRRVRAAIAEIAAERARSAA
jgi:hypothetical protein